MRALYYIYVYVSFYYIYVSINASHILFAFVSQQGVSTRARKSIAYRSMLSILKSSIKDLEMSTSDDVHSSIQSEVRFKLIIDPSADESLVRLLFTFGVLKRQSTKMYICSEFPPDSQTRVC